MAWRDKPVGFVVDGYIDVNETMLKALKEEGVRFIVSFATTSPWDVDAGFADVCRHAATVGLPVYSLHTTFPALDNYTQEDCPEAHYAVIQKALQFKKIAGAIVNAERYTVDLDLERYAKGERTAPPRTATPSNIYATNKTIYDFLSNLVDDKGAKVLVRTNDNFVSTYSKQYMGNWMPNVEMYLADWRYRVRADDGSWTKYVLTVPVATGQPPVIVENIDALRQLMPPDDSKNPLYPGKSMIFWEWSGMRYAHPLIKDRNGKPKAVNWVLFNGTEDELMAFAGKAQPEEPPVDPRTPEDPGTPEEPGIPADPETPEEKPAENTTFFARLEAGITAFAQVWLEFNSE